MNQFVVSYQSLKAFTQGIEWTGAPEELIARITHRTSQGPGMLIRHFVVLQTRVEDEIHLCKITGLLYSYWGNEFEEHRTARAHALSWAGEVEEYLVEFCTQAGLTIWPGYWQVPDIDKIVGFSWPEETQ